MGFALARLASHQLRTDQRLDFLAIETRRTRSATAGPLNSNPVKGAPFRETVIDVNVNVNQKPQYSLKIF
jgi:hypothetical protein